MPPPLYSPRLPPPFSLSPHLQPTAPPEPARLPTTILLLVLSLATQPLLVMSLNFHDELTFSYEWRMPHMLAIASIEHTSTKQVVSKRDFLALLAGHVMPVKYEVPGRTKRKKHELSAELQILAGPPFRQLFRNELVWLSENMILGQRKLNKTELLAPEHNKLDEVLWTAVQEGAGVRFSTSAFSPENLRDKFEFAVVADGGFGGMATSWGSFSEYFEDSVRRKDKRLTMAEVVALAAASSDDDSGNSGGENPADKKEPEPPGQDIWSQVLDASGNVRPEMEEKLAELKRTGALEKDEDMPPDELGTQAQMEAEIEPPTPYPTKVVRSGSGNVLILPTPPTGNKLSAIADYHQHTPVSAEDKILPQQHLFPFLRFAPEPQWDAVLAKWGEAALNVTRGWGVEVDVPAGRDLDKGGTSVIKRGLNERRVWLVTEGHAVPWVHARVDFRPDYVFPQEWKGEDGMEL